MAFSKGTITSMNETQKQVNDKNLSNFKPNQLKFYHAKRLTIIKYELNTDLERLNANTGHIFCQL